MTKSTSTSAAGEVHTLFGENGSREEHPYAASTASTSRILGRYISTANRWSISSPAAAISLGIGMIHQHFMLVPTLTVAENVSLGLKSTRGPLKDVQRARLASKSFRPCTGWA